MPSIGGKFLRFLNASGADCGLGTTNVPNVANYNNVEFNLLELFFKTPASGTASPGDMLNTYVFSSAAFGAPYTDRFCCYVDTIDENTSQIEAFDVKYVEGDGTTRNFTEYHFLAGGGFKNDTWYHLVWRFNSTLNRFQRYYGEPGDSFPSDYSLAHFPRNSAGSNAFDALLTASSGQIYVGYSQEISALYWLGSFAEFRLIESEQTDGDIEFYNNRFRPEWFGKPNGSGIHYLRINDYAPSGDKDLRAHDLWQDLWIEYDFDANVERQMAGVDGGPFAIIPTEEHRSLRVNDDAYVIADARGDDKAGRLVHLPSGAFKTWELYFKTPSAGGAAGADTIFATDDFDSNSRFDFYVTSVDAADDDRIWFMAMEFYEDNYGTQRFVSIGLSPTLELNTWYHLVSRFEVADNFFHFYIGKPEDNFPSGYDETLTGRFGASSTAFGSLTSGPSGLIKFGGDPDGETGKWAGHIAEFRVWEDERSDAQIQQYQQAFVPASAIPSTLSSYIRMNEPSGEVTMIGDLGQNEFIQDIAGITLADTSELQAGGFGADTHPFLQGQGNGNGGPPGPSGLGIDLPSMLFLLGA